jgi:hypothetical protein
VHISRFRVDVGSLLDSGFTDDETEIPEQVQTCIDDGDDPGATQDLSAHQATRIGDGGPPGSIGQGQRSGKLGTVYTAVFAQMMRRLDRYKCVTSPEAARVTRSWRCS